MARNVVLCCDGTSNEFAAHNTNVVKLYQCLIHDPGVQRTYYHPGLGTMEPIGALHPDRATGDEDPRAGRRVRALERHPRRLRLPDEQLRRWRQALSLRL